MTSTGNCQNIASSCSRSDQIGVLGGTFDPPHFGHINLALGLLEAHGLQEVWFCPTWVNPLKQGRETASADHRLAMTALAIEGISCFRLVNWECLQQQVSYTVDLIHHLVNQEELSGQPRQLRLLLGDDTANEFYRWKEPEEIVRLAPPLVGHRVDYEAKTVSENSPLLTQALLSGRTPIPLLDISSTAIRRRLHSGLYCHHLLPAKVMDYIGEHRLYLKVLDGLL